MASGGKQERPTAGSDSYLIGGLVMLSLGIIVILLSLPGYWHAVEMDEALKEEAEEAGTYAAGLDQEDTIRSYLALIAIGCLFLFVGVLLIVLAFAKHRNMQSLGSNAGKRP